MAVICVMTTGSETATAQCIRERLVCKTWVHTLGDKLPPLCVVIAAYIHSWSLYADFE